MAICFYISKGFLKKKNYFFLYFKVNVKINLLKIKNIILMHFQVKKHFKKQLPPHL